MPLMHKYTHCRMSCKWLSLYPPPSLRCLQTFSSLPSSTALSVQCFSLLLLPLISSSLPPSPFLSSAPNSVTGIKSWWQIWWQMFTVQQISQITVFPVRSSLTLIHFQWNYSFYPGRYLKQILMLNICHLRPKKTTIFLTAVEENAETQ